MAKMNVWQTTTLVVIVAVIIIFTGIYLLTSKPANEELSPITGDVTQENNIVSSSDTVLGDIEIKILGMPFYANSDEPINVRWRLTGENVEMTHTALHYGVKSIAIPKIDDYPYASQYQCVDSPCNLPKDFSASIVIDQGGSYYLRAHAIIDGKDVWSDERTIIISKPSEKTDLAEEEVTYSLEADDYGFYMNGHEVSSLLVNEDEEIDIELKVKSENVYYGGLQFKGCGLDSESIRPGRNVVLEFMIEEDCTISSYWPSSNVLKDRLAININRPRSSGGGGGGVY